MKSWQITIKIGNEVQDKLKMYDIDHILEGYLNVNRTFFDELLDIVKMINKYAVGKGLEKIIGPDKENWTQNPWLLIMAKDKENEIPFWLLFKREKDLTGHLVAIGPKIYYDYFNKNKEPEDEIKKFLEYIIAYPQKFELSILIPNYLK
jgi:hypothetical protein